MLRLGALEISVLSLVWQAAPDGKQLCERSPDTSKSKLANACRSFLKVLAQEPQLPGWFRGLRLRILLSKC